MTEVVAAIIEEDGRVLIGQRRPEQAHPLKWEFPGGKVERGETPREALVRELAEELGITVTAAQEIDRYEYTYPGKAPIAIIFIRVDRYSGSPENLIFHDLRWAPPAELKQYDFLEGDLPFLTRYEGPEPAQSRQ